MLRDSGQVSESSKFGVPPIVEDEFIDDDFRHRVWFLTIVEIEVDDEAGLIGTPHRSLLSQHRLETFIHRWVFDRFCVAVPAFECSTENCLICPFVRRSTNFDDDGTSKRTCRRRLRLG